MNEVSIEVPTLAKFLSGLGAVPQEAIVMGMATDGFPVLVNMDDINLKSILIERGRPVLETISRYTQIVKTNTECFVFSNNPFGDTGTKMWRMPECIGFIRGWAEKKRSGRLVVLVDDLDDVFDLDQQTIDNFMWVVKYGKRNRVHVIASCERCVNTKEFGAFISNEGQAYSYYEYGEKVLFYAL